MDIEASTDQDDHGNYHGGNNARYSHPDSIGGGILNSS
jgi:hypothetical protein